jgi:hypothetical protein
MEEEKPRARLGAPNKEANSGQWKLRIRLCGHDHHHHYTISQPAAKTTDWLPSKRMKGKAEDWLQCSSSSPIRFQIGSFHHYKSSSPLVVDPSFSFKVT